VTGIVSDDKAAEGFLYGSWWCCASC